MHHARRTVVNNLKIADSNLALAVKPLGVIKNDEDHYLLFMPYGENTYQKFKTQSLDPFLNQLYQFLIKVNEFHHAGYAHGDLKVDNMLFINNEIKMIDWFSLIEFNKTRVGEYRYIGDELPPEAIRALYFRKKNQLEYSIVSGGFDQQGHKKHSYSLHPIAADRFCLGMSLLEFLEPELYKTYHKQFPKGSTRYGNVLSSYGYP